MIYTPLTKKALRLCFYSHKDQLDKTGLPYVFHPFHLAEEMTDRLVAFAKTGDPNSNGYVKWNKGGEKALVLGDGETKEDNPSKLKLWITMFTNKAPGE